jgi:hypothetical protein
MMLHSKYQTIIEREKKKEITMKPDKESKQRIFIQSA